MTQPNEPLPTSAGAFTLASRPPGGLEVRATHRATGEVQTFKIGQSFVLLGRAQQAGVRLDDPSVSQCHAYLQLVDGVPHCIDLGSRTGVLWDDGGQGRGWVHPGQTLRVGMFDVQIDGTGFPLRVTAERTGADAQEDAAPLATLDVHSPAGPNGRFALDLPVTLVGRHPNCNLRFLDEAAAHFQCALVKTQEGVWCISLLSQRGTVVNGRWERVVRLRDGDLIELGKVSLLFRVGPGAAQPLTLSRTGGLHPAAASDVAGAVAAPLREMMEQFQQCFVTMARMFTTMQQEHTAMMCEQMRQVQELIRESRGAAPQSSAPPAAPAPAPPPTAPAASPAPKPKAVSPEEARQLADAHAWFLERLTQKAPHPADSRAEPS